MMRPGGDVPSVFLCTELVDFHKSIVGLSLLVEQSLLLDPFAASLYVFVNRRLDKLKILHWEKNGFCLWHKSLEKERFKWPRIIDSSDGEQLPDDTALLKALLVPYQNKEHRFESQVKKLTQQVHDVLEALQLERHRHCGSKSEKTTGQGEQFDEVELRQRRKRFQIDVVYLSCQSREDVPTLFGAHSYVNRAYKVSPPLLGAPCHRLP